MPVLPRQRGGHAAGARDLRRRRLVAGAGGAQPLPRVLGRRADGGQQPRAGVHAGAGQRHPRGAGAHPRARRRLGRPRRQRRRAGDGRHPRPHGGPRPPRRTCATRRRSSTTGARRARRSSTRTASCSASRSCPASSPRSGQASCASRARACCARWPRPRSRPATGWCSTTSGCWWCARSGAARPTRCSSIAEARTRPTWPTPTPPDLVAVGRAAARRARPAAPHVGDVAYNVVFHTAPHHHDDEHFHWHVHVVPRLTSVAGFEQGTGVLINIVAPELRRPAAHRQRLNAATRSSGSSAQLGQLVLLGDARARRVQLAARHVEAVELVRQLAGGVHALRGAVGVLDRDALALVRSGRCRCTRACPHDAEGV